MWLVDSHTHTGAKDRSRYPLATDEHSEQTAWFLDHGVTTEELLTSMAASNVTAAVLVQAFGSHGTDNTYVIDSVATHPDRLVGIGAMDLTSDDVAERARQLIEADGLQGVRLRDLGTGALRSTGALAVAETAADLGVPLLVLCCTTQVPAVRDLVDRVPDVTVVLDHCANPDLSAGPPWERARTVLSLADRAGVCLKVSSITFDSVSGHDPAGFVADAVARFGADRVLWGSDFTHTCDRPYRDLVACAQAAAARLSGADRDLVLGGTAMRLWPTLRPADSP